MKIITITCICNQRKTLAFTVFRSTVLQRLLIEVPVKSDVSLTYVQHARSEYRIQFSDEDRLRGARNEDGASSSVFSSSRRGRYVTRSVSVKARVDRGNAIIVTRVRIAA